MKRTIILLVLLFLGTACTVGPVVEYQRNQLDYDSEVHVAPLRADWQLEEARMALSAWTYATGDSFRFALMSSPGGARWSIDGGELDGVSGVARRETREIVVDWDNGQGAWEMVLLHELGHAIGLGHMPGTLMDANTGIPCIDQETIDTACDLRGCAERRTTCQ